MGKLNEVKVNWIMSQKRIDHHKGDSLGHVHIQTLGQKNLIKIQEHA